MFFGSSWHDHMLHDAQFRSYEICKYTKFPYPKCQTTFQTSKYERKWSCTAILHCLPKLLKLNGNRTKCQIVDLVCCDRPKQVAGELRWLHADHAVFKVIIEWTIRKNLAWHQTSCPGWTPSPTSTWEYFSITSFNKHGQVSDSWGLTSCTGQQGALPHIFLLAGGAA